MPRPTRALAADVAVAIVLLMATGSGLLLADWVRTVELFGGPPSPTTDWEFRSSAEIEVTGAVALAVLGGLVIVLLRRTRWLWLIVAAACTVSLVLARQHWEAGVAVGHAEGWQPSPASTLFLLALVPTSWPLLVLVPVAAYRRFSWEGRWRHATR